jgi:hypothetical protein
MRRLYACLACLLLIPVALPASEFDWMVREFSRETGASQTHIPFFGLARFIVAVGHPAGTSELRLAIFENTNLEPARFSDLTDMAVGNSWKPMVRVRSRDGESTNIYEQSNGDNLRLLITTLDRGGEATFVQVRVKPTTLMKFVDEHCQKR